MIAHDKGYYHSLKKHPRDPHAHRRSTARSKTSGYKNDVKTERREPAQVVRAHRRTALPASGYAGISGERSVPASLTRSAVARVGVALYGDRLQVTSSRTLHFGLTSVKLFAPHESLPWNPLIARTFYRRGIIEEWQRGTLKMAELTTSDGLPRPEIEDAGGCVTVRFRHDQFVPSQRGESDLTEQQRAILDLLDQSGRALARRRGAPSPPRPTTEVFLPYLPSLPWRFHRCGP